MDGFRYIYYANIAIIDNIELIDMMMPILPLMATLRFI